MRFEHRLQQHDVRGHTVTFVTGSAPDAANSTHAFVSAAADEKKLVEPVATPSFASVHG